MSTIEGGVITTNDETLHELLLQLRSHGWARDLSEDRKNSLRERHGIDEFSELYTFYVPGFNLRSTDLQAFIGLEQLKKIDKMIIRRNENLQYYKQLLNGKVWFPTEVENSYTANFSIPVILETAEKKKQLVSLLRQNGVECRPLISGSMGTQPFYTKLYGRLILPKLS